MEIPCDTTIAAAVADYLDAGDFTTSSRTTYRRVLEGMAQALGPELRVAELDAGELAGWFVRTRDAYRPATWNRDRVIVRAFVRHLQDQGAALKLPALGHRRVRPDTTRALSRADVERILAAPTPLREKTLWRLLYESARRAGLVFAIRRPSRVIPAVLDRGPEGTAWLSYRRAAELFKAHAGATLHQLRHSALTHMAEDGASAPMLMTKSRHQSIASLGRYARPSVEALQQWEATHDPARRRNSSL